MIWLWLADRGHRYGFTSMNPKLAAGNEKKKNLVIKRKCASMCTL